MGTIEWLQDIITAKINVKGIFFYTNNFPRRHVFVSSGVYPLSASFFSIIDDSVIQLGI